MSTVLLDLLVELLDEVYSLLDGKARRSLRLVSSACAEMNQRAFADIHFQELNIVFSCRKSLERALAILNHPGFGARVRKIAVYLDRYHESGDAREAYKAYQTKRQDLQQRGLDQTLLRQIFQQARALNKLDDVKIETAYDAVYRARGENAAGYNEPDITSSTHFLKVLNIISKSHLGSKFSGTTIAKSTTWSLPVHEAMKSHQFRDDFYGAARKATSLSLDIWADYDALYWDPCKHFFRLVAGAPHLRHLGIKSRNEFDPALHVFAEDHLVDRGTIGREILSQTFPALQSLEMRFLNICLADLVKFLNRHPRVARVKLVSVKIEWRGYGDELDGSMGLQLTRDLARVTNRSVFDVDSCSKMWTRW